MYLSIRYVLHVSVSHTHTHTLSLPKKSTTHLTWSTVICCMWLNAARGKYFTMKAKSRFKISNKNIEQTKINQRKNHREKQKDARHIFTRQNYTNDTAKPYRYTLHKYIQRKKRDTDINAMVYTLHIVQHVFCLPSNTGYIDCLQIVYMNIYISHGWYDPLIVVSLFILIVRFEIQTPEVPAQTTTVFWSFLLLLLLVFFPCHTFVALFFVVLYFGPRFFFHFKYIWFFLFGSKYT